MNAAGCTELEAELYRTMAHVEFWSNDQLGWLLLALSAAALFFSSDR